MLGAAARRIRERSLFPPRPFGTRRPGAWARGMSEAASQRSRLGSHDLTEHWLELDHEWRDRFDGRHSSRSPSSSGRPSPGRHRSIARVEVDDPDPVLRGSPVLVEQALGEAIAVRGGWRDDLHDEEQGASSAQLRTGAPRNHSLPTLASTTRKIAFDPKKCASGGTWSPPMITRCAAHRKSAGRRSPGKS